MVEMRPTGRSTRELAEVTPLYLDCGDAFQPGRVIVGYEAHPLVTGMRVRTYRCLRCGTVTYTEPG